MIKIADNLNYLATASGTPFFVSGANYEGYFDRPWQMWDKFDASLIDRDFAKMAASGLNTVRLFVQTPLEIQIQAGNFSHLDKVLQLAANHQLYVILALNDRHHLKLTEVQAIDRKIVHRYQHDPIILAWDLENEPVFYNFVGSVYPTNQTPPVHTPQLIDHYGERVTQADALALQADGRIPGGLNPQQAWYYINALRLFIEFNTDAVVWNREHGGTILAYMHHAAAAAWQPLIAVLQGTLEAWLNVRLNAIRAIDTEHLTTVGYNWLHFAGLAPNQRLDVQQLHRYGSATPKKMTDITTALHSLKNIFPNQPLLLGEYGFSNHTTTDPATSQPVSVEKTALFESALLAWLRANQLAGGLKWMLNDVEAIENPYEANFGIYRVGDYPKPIHQVLAAFHDLWPAPTAHDSRLTQVPDPAGLAYRLDVGDSITLAGGSFQDQTFSWQGSQPGHCFVQHTANTLTAWATVAGQLALDPWEFLPAWQLDRSAILSRVSNQTVVEHARFEPGGRVSWHLQVGVRYQLTLNNTPTDPQVFAPPAGEHVVLLGDSNEQLRLALPYIRHFSPDISFNPQSVSGRWQYATVVATTDQFSDDALANLHGNGLQLVERLEGDVAAVVQQLVAANRPFLAAVPVTAAAVTRHSGGNYTVQPGDSLPVLAQRFYGNRLFWPALWQANQDLFIDFPDPDRLPAVIQANGYPRLKPGLLLKIPKNPQMPGAND